MQEIFSLTGKTILVTGASSGIGRAVAQQCAAAGATCILTARNQERLQQTLTSLNGEGHSVIVADLSTVEGVQELVSALPKVNGIVCCAGVVETQMLKFTDDSDLQKLFNTNAFSAIRLIREAVQQKRLQKESSIVMISSISGVVIWEAHFMAQRKAHWKASPRLQLWSLRLRRFVSTLSPQV